MFYTIIFVCIKRFLLDSRINYSELRFYYARCNYRVDKNGGRPTIVQNQYILCVLLWFRLNINEMKMCVYREKKQIPFLNINENINETL